MGTKRRGSMDRRSFIKGSVVGACSVTLSCSTVGRVSSQAGLSRRPNIVFVFSDQQRWDTVGCYGETIFPGLTPHLDRMAKEGVRFENAFTCQPVCGPARSCLQTGKWATETGCFKNDIGLPRDEKTIAHWFSEAGYEVGYIGKWHLASTGQKGIDYKTKAVPPELRGGYKDYWLASDVLEFTSHGYDGYMYDAQMNRVEFPKDRYRADCLTDFALNYLRARDRKRPFFLFLSYLEPHHQNDHGHFEGPRGSRERFRNFRVPGDLVGTKGDWKTELPDHLGCISSLDANLGRIRAELRNRGMADNTLIVYTSDHACHFRTRNGEYKRSCHDNSIRVPMIAHGPGFTGGKVVRQLVSLIDLPPTFLTAGGIAPPPTMRGSALQPLAGGKTGQWRDAAFVQISESHVGRAIRTKDWKYSVRALGKSGGKDMNSDAYAEDCLYDLQADPHERNNLARAPNHARTRAALAQILKREMVLAGEKEPRIESAPPQGAGA